MLDMMLRCPPRSLSRLAVLASVVMACHPKASQEPSPDGAASAGARSSTSTQAAAAPRPADVERLMAAAAMIERNDLQQAEAELERMREEHPQDPQVLAIIARLRRQQQHHEAEARSLEAALELAPEDLTLHRMLAYAYRDAGQLERAGEAFGVVFTRQPNTPLDGLAFGAVLNELGRHKQAEPVLRRVIALDPHARIPDGPGAFTLLGDALRGQDRLDDALDAYDKAREERTADKYAFAGAALVHEARGDTQRALDQWSNYIQIDCCSDFSREVAQPHFLDLGEPRGRSTGESSR